MTYYAATDIISPTTRKTYAKRGEVITIIAQRSDIYVVSNEKGEAFPCHKDKLCLEKPLDVAVEEGYERNRFI